MTEKTDEILDDAGYWMQKLHTMPKKVYVVCTKIAERAIEAGKQIGYKKGIEEQIEKTINVGSPAFIESIKQEGRREALDGFDFIIELIELGHGEEAINKLKALKKETEK